MSPWQWHDLKQKYTYTDDLIKSLVDQGKYEFTLTGKFEDIMGNDISVEYDELSSSGKRAVDHIAPSEGRGPRDAQPQDDPVKPLISVDFKPQPGDPEPVNPTPPVVKIKVLKEKNMPQIPSKGISLFSYLVKRQVAESPH